MSDTHNGRDTGASGGWNLGQKAPSHSVEPQSNQSGTSSIAHQKIRNGSEQENDDALLPSSVTSESFAWPITRLGNSSNFDASRFTSDTTLDFEALSYTWGSTENNVNIFVSETSNNTLSVTKNLAQALPYLRHTDKPRVLWIDAISVNQEDLSERSSQVRRMPNVYSKATRVVIWLGLESFDSRMAFEYLRLIASNYHVHWRTYIIDPMIENESPWARPREIMPLSDEQYRSILNLIDRGWFERLWVWQEACLANETSVVVCGIDTIPWKIVCEAMFCLTRKPFPPDVYPSFAKRFDDIQYLFISTSQVSGFNHLLKQTNFCKCADPRDKIYALLGMLGKNQLDIEPDYTKSVHEVYKDTTLKLIHKTKSLDVLLHTTANDSNILYSWVPDWKKPLETASFNACNASGASSADCIADPDGILRVTGRSVSRIARAEPVNVHKFEVDHSYLILELRLIASKLGLLDNSFKFHEHVRALCEVLCSDQFTYRYIPFDNNILDVLEAERSLLTILESPDDVELGTEFQLLLSKIERYCHGRSLFLTEDGHLGLAPQGTRPGDLVEVLLGCSSCMMLRPVALDPMCHSKQQYKIVGEAYCHGIMQGEAILGPLPGLFDAVLQFNDSSGRYEWVHIDRGTGRMETNDPRLGELSKEWTRTRQEGSMHYVFLNAETGESTGRDPRLNPDALRARGVELEVFDLI
ncbi:hypothetical protein IFR05_008449 [Cadophora sp. M221]|nr:hypothetical protein IFR05_008449 [Cadophora sp. M221]